VAGDAVTRLCQVLPTLGWRLLRYRDCRLSGDGGMEARHGQSARRLQDGKGFPQ
jgi:hypothetical protein